MFIVNIELYETYQSLSKIVQIIKFHNYKCSSNYYHFSSSITFVFVNVMFFAVFLFLEGCIFHVRHVKYVHKICFNYRIHRAMVLNFC